jgi:hypothetical protein
MNLSAAPVRDAGDIVDRLQAAAADALRVNAALEELIEHPARRPAGVVRRSGVTGSSPSWHAQAAYLVLELQCLARTLERRLHVLVSGHAQRRGGSDRNTALALALLPNLAAACRESDVWEVWRALDAWLQRGRTALGEIEPLALLPRQPGKREPRCPWCYFHTLRYQTQAGLVRCVNPACLDGDGHRPLARVELGRISGSVLLAWRDGSTGLPGDDD